MADREILGGYLVEGTPEEGDWLWFTGARWTPIPFGTEGEIVALAPPSYENTPFTSNGYIVVIEDLQPGQVLVAMCGLIPEGNRYHEYITNAPPPNWKIGIEDLGCTFTAYPGVFTEPAEANRLSASALTATEAVGDSREDSEAKSNAAASMGRSFSITIS